MMVHDRAVLVLSAAIVALAFGCASKSTTASRRAEPSTGGPVAASPTTSNLTGTWRGNVGVGARSTSVNLDLRQQGPGLTGNLAVGGRPDLSGPVTGMVEGDTLRLRLESGAASPELRVQGDTLTGLISGEPLSARRVR